MTGALVDTVQRYPSTYRAGAALMGKLGLLYARGLGLTKTVGHPGHSEPALFCTIKLQQEYKQRHLSVPPNLEKVTATLLSFGRVLGMVPVYYGCFLKTAALFLCPGIFGSRAGMGQGPSLTQVAGRLLCSPLHYQDGGRS